MLKINNQSVKEKNLSSFMIYCYIRPPLDIPMKVHNQNDKWHIYLHFHLHHRFTFYHIRNHFSVRRIYYNSPFKMVHRNVFVLLRDVLGITHVSIQNERGRVHDSNVDVYTDNNCAMLFSGALYTYLQCICSQELHLTTKLWKNWFVNVSNLLLELHNQFAV